MQLFYTPQHARVGDVIPYYEDGKFHLFYLKNWNPYFGSDRKDGWHLLNTKDMVHYGPETAIGILGGTGSVIKADGIYHYITASLNRIRSGSTSATRRAVIWTVGRNTKKKHSDRTKRSICRPTGAIHTCSGMRKKTAGGCCCARRAREKQAAAAVWAYVNLPIFTTGSAVSRCMHRMRAWLRTSARTCFTKTAGGI